jgi:hypothetical protein
VKNIQREVEQSVRPAIKKCPRAWAQISAKRYLLPNYRSPDYFNQGYLDHLMFLFLTGYFGTVYGTIPDPVIRAMYMLYVSALMEGRPVYFLERELAQSLLATNLLPDFHTDDIHWRRKALRIMLPRDLIGFQREGQLKRSIMCLDICRLSAGEDLFLAEPVEAELSVVGNQAQINRGRTPSKVLIRPHLRDDGFVIGGQLDYAWVEGKEFPVGEHYATIRPNGKIGQVIHVGEDFDFETGAPCDDTDDELLARMQHLALNILLFMGSVPDEYDTAEKAFRKGGWQGQHHTSGLFAAKWVGKSQYRPKTKGVHHATFTGRHLHHHWRAGHWKRQPHGEKSAQRKLIWIEPYAAGQLEEPFDAAASP